MASDGSSKGFEFSKENTPTCGKDPATLQREGWITADGVLAPTHDAAQVQWGDGWRMPTHRELNDLCNKCDWTEMTTNGVIGAVVRGRGDYASASIFLPAVGAGIGSALANCSHGGLYWSSVPDSDSDYARRLFFLSGYHYTSNFSCRYGGLSIRPVQGFTK